TGMPLAGGGSTAHVDTFARDRLPPRELWPEMGCPNLPELESYPHRLNAAGALLDAAVARGWGSRTAVRYGALAWSYRDLQEKTDRVARVLAEDMGLKPGERVLLRSPNTPMMAAAWLAVLKAGGIAVATMPLLRAREVAVILERAQVSHALCSVDTREALEQARGGSPLLRHVALFTADGEASRPEADLDCAMKSKPAAPFPAVDTAADDPALIAFTSGTTGRPKGCVHFHRDVLAVCDAFPRYVFGARMDDVYTGTPPLAFVYGLGGLLLFPLRYGACTAFPTERATPDVLLRTVAEQRCTTLFSSPAMYRSLAEAAGSFDLGSLQKCVSAGETLPAATFESFRKATGLRVIDGIGSTELLHMFVASAGDAIRPGATGRAIPGYEVRVADEEGRTVPPGELGQIAVRGFTGCRYLDDEERQRAYVRDGWNYPGDVYRRDADGYFWYQARADDMIISAGYNIAGPEVEAALLDHPRVRECAVVAAADPVRGTIVKAFVVLREREGAGEGLVRELQDFVKREI
ncbi:MAG TPA: AMP-binding protein, partial [Vicinamibacteria bacterium]